MSTLHWRRVLRAGAPATPLHELAVSQGWQRIADEPRRHHHSRRLGWKAAGDVEVHLLEFFTHDQRTVVLAGEGPDGGPIAASVEAALDLRTLDEIYADATSDDPRAALSGFYGLTELTPLVIGDPRTSEAYLHVLRHKEMVVRAAALRLTGAYRAWPGLKDALIARRRVEPDLAELVDEMIEYLDEEESA